MCPFVLFLLVIVFSVLRYTNSDYPFDIFKLFLVISAQSYANSIHRVFNCCPLFWYVQLIIITNMYIASDHTVMANMFCLFWFYLFNVRAGCSHRWRKLTYSEKTVDLLQCNLQTLSHKCLSCISSSLLAKLSLLILRTFYT